MHSGRQARRGLQDGGWGMLRRASCSAAAAETLQGLRAQPGGGAREPRRTESRRAPTRAERTPAPTARPHRGGEGAPAPGPGLQRGHAGRLQTPAARGAADPRDRPRPVFGFPVSLRALHPGRTGCRPPLAPEAGEGTSEASKPCAAGIGAALGTNGLPRARRSAGDWLSPPRRPSVRLLPPCWTSPDRHVPGRCTGLPTERPAGSPFTARPRAGRLVQTGGQASGRVAAIAQTAGRGPGLSRGADPGRAPAGPVDPEKTRPPESCAGAGLCPSESCGRRFRARGCRSGRFAGRSSAALASQGREARREACLCTAGDRPGAGCRMAAGGCCGARPALRPLRRLCRACGRNPGEARESPGAQNPAGRRPVQKGLRRQRPGHTAAARGRPPPGLDCSGGTRGASRPLQHGAQQTPGTARGPFLDFPFPCVLCTPGAQAAGRPWHPRPAREQARPRSPARPVSALRWALTGCPGRGVLQATGSPRRAAPACDSCRRAGRLPTGTSRGAAPACPRKGQRDLRLQPARGPDGWCRPEGRPRAASPLSRRQQAEALAFLAGPIRAALLPGRWTRKRRARPSPAQEPASSRP